MVETTCWFKGFKIVARKTINLAYFFKLTEMNINMTINAALRKVSKLLMQRAALVLLKMTRTACLLFMCTLQFVFRLIVVKIYLTPPAFGMAIFAG